MPQVAYTCPVCGNVHQHEEPAGLPPGYLSPHFTLAEMIYSDTAKARGIDNTPNATEKQALSDLCNKTLEKIRDICKQKPVTVTSGFRSQALNQAVGGASNSAHRYGCAADIVIPTYGDVLSICRAVQPHVNELQIDQLIFEQNSSGGQWVHVGRANPGSMPRGQCFSIKSGYNSNTPFPGV